MLAEKITSIRLDHQILHRLLISILFFFFINGCSKDDNPVTSEESPVYKIVFTSDRDSDGQTQFEFGLETEVYSMNTDGSELLRITNNELWDGKPQFISEGNEIIFTSGENWFRMHLMVANNDGTNVRNLSQCGYNYCISNTSRIALESQGIMEVMNFVGSERLSLRYWADSLALPSGQDFPVQFSSDGKKLLFNSNRGGTYNIYIMESNGSFARKLTSSDLDVNCSFSPDDLKILYQSNRTGKTQVYLMNIDGTDQTQLTFSQNNSDPSFSPDGKHIVFISKRDNQSEIYLMNSDGTNQTRLTNNSNAKSTPLFSPDEKFILYVEKQSGKNDIMLLNINTNTIKNLTNGQGNNYSAQFSKVILK